MSSPSSSSPSSPELTTELLGVCRLAAEQAGELVMSHRATAAGVKKADGSPVTVADTLSEELIRSHLFKHAPSIPLIGEESVAATTQAPQGRFWLVDPLDGTKAYLRGEDEFTVNIALIEERRPVLGVVYAPAMGRAFAAAEGVGAFQGATPLAAKTPIKVRPPPKDGLAVLTSSLHEPPTAVAKSFPELNINSVRSMSSSIKFCIIAAAEADFYPRRNPTMEWDTAAGQAVLEIAGGKVTADGSPMPYGKPSFKNDAFVACGGD